MAASQSQSGSNSEPQSPLSQQDRAADSSPTFSTPAGEGSFAQSVQIGETDSKEAAKLQTDKPKPDGKLTAELVAQSVNALCVARWAAPLTTEEHTELVSDTAAVLRKYNVPDLPASEEISLAVTLLKIGIPRALSAGGDDDNDSLESGQEGEREDGSYTKAGVPSSGGADPSLDLIS